MKCTSGSRLALLASILASFIVCPPQGLSHLSAQSGSKNEPSTARDATSIIGVWQVVSYRHDGQPLAVPKRDCYTFAAGQLSIETFQAPPAHLRYLLRPEQSPRQLDLILEDGSRKEVSPMIYVLANDTLTICYAPPGEARPRELLTQSGDKRTLIVMRRNRAGATNKEITEEAGNVPAGPPRPTPRPATTTNGCNAI